MKVFLQLSDSDRILLTQFPIPEIEEVTVPISSCGALSEYIDILNLTPVSGFPKEYQHMCGVLGIEGVEALHAIPEHKLKGHLNDIEAELQKIFDVEENVNYLAAHLAIKEFLTSLSTALLDFDKLNDLINASEHDTVKSSIRSFFPKSGHTQPIAYSTNHSVTGRLVVESGPQVLTAPAEVRKCFRSRYDGGRILQLDIVSAEPKLALHVANIPPPTDVYAHLAKSILGDAVTREQAKLITLCALYGQSSRRLARKLPPKVSAKQVIQKTKKFFEIDELEEKLREEARGGTIRNILGRPITLPDDSDHILISYFLQSSIAEGAILMFADFIEHTELACEPLFVIHDALIMDCDSAAGNELLAQDTIKLNLLDWEFDVSITDLTDN